MIWRVAALGLLALIPNATSAQAAEPVTISGAVKAPLVLDAAELKSQAATTVNISFKTAKGTEQGSYTGVLLWDLVKQAGLVNDPGKNTELRHTIVVTGQDGYSVALSLGEIDPDYQGNHILLAYEGSAPPVSVTDLRLVVPGDAHGGRAVRDVVKIEVR